ncbi:hypothetical protein HLB44_36355 [Aquincola sp. S2]|uniref:Uncharacterized protein n=1 Tax=Pseudaquabacterium terrae TaxID=2732868 RepID=A0ABX2EUU5_9BURK|nr:hypothetical protein [Aquabacterium terrae]NRF72436.1 hypothetical protein [Aquabacterium terrae]
MENTINNTIFGDLAQIEKTLSEDTIGERARAMISYFEEVSKNSEKMLSQPIAENERRLVTQLIEGFRASQRIIRHVWETLHSASLPA